MLVYHTLRGSETEVGEEDRRTILGGEDVLRLEVAVNDTSGVQALDTLDNLGSIEPCTVATKPAPAR